jgi:hypothetical protein
MSYAITPAIIVPSKEDKIEDTWDYRLGVLMKMIYDDNPFTEDYYRKTHIPCDYISMKFSDHLMCIMMRNDVDKFIRIYKFCKKHNITIIYTSGLNLWFRDMIIKNSYEIVHDEMKTMKLNNNNIILLKFGKPSKTLTRLQDVFKDVKIDTTNAIKMMVSEPTVSLWNHIDIYKFLNSMLYHNIASILQNLYIHLSGAYNMDITHMNVNTDLIFMLTIMIKKMGMNCVHLNVIINYLHDVTAIPPYQIAKMKENLYAMAPYYSPTKSRKIFI